MTQSQVFDALGLTPGDDSGNTPDFAEPANRELGAPAPEEMPSATEEGERQTDEKPGEQARRTRAGAGTSDTEASAQAEEKRARADAAARRRRQETRDAIDRALAAEREKHKAEMNALFQAAGLKNTVTGTPITNMEELSAWKQASDTAHIHRDLEDGKLTPEGLDQAISNSPVMRRIMELVERGETARRERDMAAAQARIDTELQEIHALDPSIRTTEDLLSMPAAKEFYEYVRKGNTFLDAFYLANRQRLTREAAEAARQQTMNAARSKDHLHPAGTSRGSGASAVPAEELALFKLLNPEATEAEIQAYYNRSAKPS